jgi:hypothetical protein
VPKTYYTLFRAVPEGRLNKRRPKSRWADGVDSDSRVRDWTNFARDRAQWRDFLQYALDQILVVDPYKEVSKYFFYFDVSQMCSVAKSVTSNSMGKIFTIHNIYLKIPWKILNAAHKSHKKYTKFKILHIEKIGIFKKT